MIETKKLKAFKAFALLLTMLGSMSMLYNIVVLHPENFQHVHEVAPRVYTNKHVAIATILFGNHKHSSFAEQSRKNKQDYCKKTKCSYMESDLGPITVTSAMWQKITNVLQIFKHGFPLVWMLDFDTILMDPTYQVASLVEEPYDVYLTIDCNGINAGSILMRKSNWTIMFLQEVYRRRNDGVGYGFNEQGAISYLYLSNWHNSQSHIKVVNQTLLNAYPREYGCSADPFVPGKHPVLHFASCTNRNDCDQIYQRYIGYSKV